MTSRSFKCKCGAIQFELTGDPVLNCNCHCHSCVATCRYIDEKKGGTSGIKDHGVAFSFFKPDQIGKLPDSLKELGAVKVGDNGKNLRLFAQCCGTSLGFANPKLIGLNRNAIYENDGKEYQPSDPVINGRKKDAFDQSIVPEPSHNMYPISFLLKMIGPMLNPFGPKFGEDGKVFFPDLAKAETVEITW